MRLSIAFLLLSLSPRQIFVWVIRVIMLATVMQSITYFFFLAFACQPVYYFWQRFEGVRGSCMDIETIMRVMYTISAISSSLEFANIPKEESVGVLPYGPRNAVCHPSVLSTLWNIANHLVEVLLQCSSAYIIL
jgi:hypothetical protein